MARPTEDDPAAIWQRVRSELQASLPAATFDLWLEPLRAAGSSGETLYVTGPARVRTWVERRYLEQLEASLRRLETGFERIVLVDAERDERDVGAAKRPVAEPLPIDPTHTFDRFVIGPGSRFAHSAALAVAELPGEAYNPLFLHGPPGLGQDPSPGRDRGLLPRPPPRPDLPLHDRRALHQRVRRRPAHGGPGALQGALPRARRAPDRRRPDPRGQAPDRGGVRPHLQCPVRGRQADRALERPPAGLARAARAAPSRPLRMGPHRGGRAAGPPHPVALLWRFAGDAVDQLPDPDVLRTIATRVPGNVRRLEGALTRVLAVSSVFDEPLAGSASPGRCPSRPNPGAGARASSRRQAWPRSRRRSPPCSASRARRSSPSSARPASPAPASSRCSSPASSPPLSLAQIAREFDRDHSTVLHSLKVVAQRNEPGSERRE